MREGMKRVSAQVVLVTFFYLSLFSCGGGGGGGGAPGGGTSGADTTAPTVSSTSSANGATGVAVNAAISVIFSEPMDAATINASTFTVKAGATAVPGTVSYSGTTATFTPTDNLAYSTSYTATVTTGAKDLAGNALSSNYVWNFTSSSSTTLPGPVPPPASGLGTLGELPKSAPTPMGTTDNAAAVLAKQVLAGDAGSLPALLRAIDLAGFTIQHDGVTVQAPSGVSQGIAFQAWEVQTIDKLMRDRLAISFGEVAALFALTTTETASVPFETLMYEGIRTNATGTNAALRFWAQFIIELGWQGPYAYDLMSDNTLTNVTVDAVQTAFIFKRLSGDLAAFANNHSPTPLKARSLRAAVRAAGTASSPCVIEGVKTEIMDWSAAGINFGFGELMEYLDGAGLDAAGKIGKITGISNMVLAYVKLAATKALFTAQVEMNGGPPLKRTKSTSTDGERRTLTATVTMDSTNAQWVNCLRPAINVMGLDFDLPNAGAVPDAEINWRLVRPRPKVLAGGTVDHGIVQFVGGDPVHAAGNITNSLGQSTFDIEGVRQPKAISPTAKEVKKEAMVYADVILKPANMYQDIKDAITSTNFGFSFLDGVITLPAELLYRTRWMFGRGYEFEVIDWSQGFTGSIIITEKGKKTERESYYDRWAESSGSYEDQRTLDITDTIDSHPYDPDIGYAIASLSASITTINTEKLRGDQYRIFEDGINASCSAVESHDWSRNDLSIEETLQQGDVSVDIFPDGHYEIYITAPPETQVGKFANSSDKLPLRNGPNWPCNFDTFEETGESHSTTRQFWRTKVGGTLDPNNPNRLKGSQVSTDYYVGVGPFLGPNRVLGYGGVRIDTTVTIEWDLGI